MHPGDRVEIQYGPMVEPDVTALLQAWSGGDSAAGGSREP